jgi:hypothetical protein
VCVAHLTPKMQDFFCHLPSLFETPSLNVISEVIFTTEVYSISPLRYHILLCINQPHQRMRCRQSRCSVGASVVTTTTELVVCSTTASRVVAGGFGVVVACFVGASVVCSTRSVTGGEVVIIFGFPRPRFGFILPQPAETED